MLLILNISWDGEEYGLLGSVEFVEKHARILDMQTVAYINVDFGVKGTSKLQAKGTIFRRNDALSQTN